MSAPASATPPTVGTGATPTASQLALRELQKRFTPEKQVEFLQTTASRILTQTGLIGTVLAAGGLVAVSTVLTNPVSFGWMVAAVGLSTLAVLLALLTQVTWLRKIRIGDITEVQKWFERYKSWRGYFLAAATWILVAAFVAAVVAVGTALWGRTVQPTFDATVSITPGEVPSPDTYTVKANFTVPPAGGGDDQFTLTIETGTKTVASTQKHAVADAAITVTLEAAGLPTTTQVIVTGKSDGWTCTATIGSAEVDGTSCVQD
ncbi:hypothetical protein [Microbacterium kyungheense]|uniref:Uncharacterized protein n=1 Tax=Microbacterium kyungheense TaxID=1263636 RepID=A0A543FKE2_9MICO|nr:hypothetical protein [Microbacterium kyungheense]TQM34252.1 hypothetical protein FB391_0539 [Microbacterium kyungheense]